MKYFKNIYALTILLLWTTAYADVIYLECETTDKAPTLIFALDTKNNTTQSASANDEVKG